MPSGVAVLCEEPAIKLEISVERVSFVPCLVPPPLGVLFGVGDRRSCGCRGDSRCLPAHGWCVVGGGLTIRTQPTKNKKNKLQGKSGRAPLLTARCLTTKRGEGGL